MKYYDNIIGSEEEIWGPASFYIVVARGYSWTGGFNYFSIYSYLNRNYSFKIIKGTQTTEEAIALVAGIVSL